MSGNIADQVEIENRQREQKAWKRYVELLEKNSGEAADVSELHDLMEKLGKSPADVQADAATLKSANIARDRIAAAKGATKRAADAKDAVRLHEEETAQILRQRQQRQDELQREVTQRIEESAAATRDIEGLNALKTKNPELLRHLKLATQDDVA